MSRVVSFLVLFGVIAVFGFWFYQVLSGFLLALFLATLLVVMFRPWHRWFVERCGGRIRIAAALTTGAVVVTVIVPAALLVMLVAWEWTSWEARRTSGEGDVEKRTLTEKLNARTEAVRRSLGLELPYAGELRYIESSLRSLLAHAARGATYQGDEGALVRLRHTLGELKDAVEESAHSAAAEQIERILTTLEIPSEKPEVTAGSFRYLQMLRDAEKQFYELKRTLIGGPVRIWAAELVNPTDEEIQGFAGWATGAAPRLLRSVGGATGSFVGSSLLTIVVTMIALYFFLADGPAMVESIMRLSPLDDDHERELIGDFDRISRAVVLATLLSAVVQGLLAGLGFWFVSLFVDDFRIVFTLTLLTTVTALVPFVGAAAVWLPVCLWLMFFHEQSHPVLAVVLGLYGAGIVSTADNVIKPLVLHGQSNLHPLLALLSVLGGVKALGPIGILVGPMVVVFLQTLLNILQRELKRHEESEREDSPPSPLPFIFSLRRRGLRLPYATPTK